MVAGWHYKGSYRLMVSVDHGLVVTFHLRGRVSGNGSRWAVK